MPAIQSNSSEVISSDTVSFCTPSAGLQLLVISSWSVMLKISQRTLPASQDYRNVGREQQRDFADQQRAAFCMMRKPWGHGVCTCKEEEDTVSHGAEHSSEALADDESEQHVDGHIDSSARSARLQGLNLPAA